MTTNETLLQALTQSLKTDDATVCIALACLFDANKINLNAFMSSMVERVVNHYARPEGQRKYPNALTTGQVNAVRKTMLREVDTLVPIFRPAEEIDWEILKGRLGIPLPGSLASPSSKPQAGSWAHNDPTDEELAAEFLSSEPDGGRKDPPVLVEKLKPLVENDGARSAGARSAAEAASIGHFGSLANHMRLHPGDFKAGRLILASDF